MTSVWVTRDMEIVNYEKRPEEYSDGAILILKELQP